MTAGRPSKFKPEYIEKIKDFFNVEASRFEVIETFEGKNGKKEKMGEIANNLPTIQKFCYSIDITKETLHNWLNNARDTEYKGEDKEDLEKFLDAYMRAKENQESIWLENSLKSLYNPQFAIFLGKNVFGYKDKVEQSVEHSGEIKNPSGVFSALTAVRDKVVGK